MGIKYNAMFGASLLSLFGACAAHAQEAPETSAEELVVVGERVARGNSVVGADQIAALPAAQNVVDAIRLVPGVLVRGSDSFNNDPWSYAINIRGFEVNLRNSKIGQTLDGVPLFNASYYLGGAPAQKFILSEDVSRIQVNQGTADVGSPAAAALGGTIAYHSRDPGEENGGLVRATFGSFNSTRFFGRYDTGEMFGNTRAFVSVANLEAPLWPHNGSTPAAIEQFALAGKSVSEFGPLTLTLYGSFNDSDDDPIIESTRAFINNTGFNEDGSTATFNTADAAANEYWADEWAAVRENTLGYAKVEVELNDAVSFDITPYFQRNEGVGEFLPPAIRPRFINVGGVNRQVQFGGVEVSSSARATRVNAGGFGVQPYSIAGGVATERTYIALDGTTTVRSSDCFNTDNSLRLNAAGLPLCSSAQSYRTSLYYHKRLGFVANGRAEIGNHTVRVGAWYENLDRDFGRAWRAYSDIRQGPVGVGGIYRRDFEQNFKTDLWKFYIADDWNVTDRLLVSVGLQHYLVDIEGTSVEAPSSASVLNQFDAAGVQVSTRRLKADSDSNELLPSIGFVYDLNDQLQVFGGYSKNFGAIGDWALEKTGTDLSSLSPEVSSNFDGGLRFRGDRVRGGLTAYFNDYQEPIVFLTNDFAVGTPGINYSAGTGGTYFNIKGGIETKGVEGSLEFDVTEALTAYVAASFVSAEYTSAFRAASYGGNALTVPAGATVAGTPDVILSGALSYERGPFSARLSARHIGEAPGDAANTAALFVPSYTLADLSARYRVELGEGSFGSFVELGLAVNNLTDERYIGGVLDEFTQRYTVGSPRTASFTLSMGF